MESSGLYFFLKNENQMHPHPVHNFKKRKREYLYNFMKVSHGIKRLYGGAGRGYGGGGRICPHNSICL